MYIGMSQNIEKRWKTHKKAKFPDALFTYEIIMECDIEQLNFWEIAWITSERSVEFGYNKTLGGTSLSSIIHNDEVKEKMSAANKGKPSPLKGRSLSEKHKEKLCKVRIGRKPNLGKKHSEEAIAKFCKLQECPYCGKSGKSNVMKRWHFEKCKEKK